MRNTKHVAFCKLPIPSTFSFSSSADVNECLVQSHTCGLGFDCVNTEGSFRCTARTQCSAGFGQDAQGNCIGEEGAQSPPQTCPVALCCRWKTRPHSQRQYILTPSIIVNIPLISPLFIPALISVQSHSVSAYCKLNECRFS